MCENKVPHQQHHNIDRATVFLHVNLLVNNLININLHQIVNSIKEDCTESRGLERFAVND